MKWCGSCKFTPEKAALVLTGALILQYLDRSIIAGAGTSIKSEENGFNIGTTLLGLLQSSFLVGYMVGALAFAHFTAQPNSRPIRMLSISFLLWIIAVVLSFLSKYVSSSPPKKLVVGNLIDTVALGLKSQQSIADNFGYSMLLLARMLSGIGEAALSTLSLPYFDRALKPETKGMYIGIYYSAIPVGTALGYIWAGGITKLFNGQWNFCFLLEAPLMIPFLILTWKTPDNVYFKRFHKPDGDEFSAFVKLGDRGVEDQARDIREKDAFLGDHNVKAIEDQLTQGGNDFLLANRLNSASSVGSIATLESDLKPEHEKLPFLKNLGECLKHPIYTTGVLGYAVYTAVVSGLGFYIPLFLQIYRPGDNRWQFTQSEADLIFGLLIGIAGFIGTLLGGKLLDFVSSCSMRSSTSDKYVAVTKLILAEISVSFTLGVIMLQLVAPAGFFTLMFLCTTVAMTVSPPINLLLIWSVPEINRPMASALTVALIHILGDVPSPVLIGWLDENFQPIETLSSILVATIGAALIWSIILCIPRQSLYD